MVLPHLPTVCGKRQWVNIYMSTISRRPSITKCLRSYKFGLPKYYLPTSTGMGYSRINFGSFSFWSHRYYYYYYYYYYSNDTTAHCGLWPVEQCPSIFSYLPPTLSFFSLPALDLFLLPLSIFSWVFPFFSSLPVLE